ncbi:hypothetical protein JW926_09530 [Candidatus Sumerlaeota bacterium]|nr:hypothetical protein [Candidatus Sumerlaeota bacterium]
MIKPREISENAMLFKDITQWIRNKTFLALFLSLLFGAGAISFFFVPVSGDAAQLGVIAFSIFTIILFIYTLVIAGMGFNLTSREFANKTFELYELSGMSLERMILGKLLSLLTQFLFGYFCIVPFMFFAYFLGGLDFISIFGASFLMILFSVPLYLFILLLSLSSKSVKIGLIGRIFVGIVLLYMGFGLLSLIFIPRSPLSGVSDFIKSLLTFDLEALKIALVFFIFYIQLCFLLFYICCNFISSTNDSRELQIKLLLFTLFLSWLLVFHALYRNAIRGSDAEIFLLVYIPVYLMLFLLGALFYYHAFHPPLIIRNRQKEARGFRRFLYHLFLPGARGTHRLILYMLLITALSVFFHYVGFKTGKNDPRLLLHAGSYCLQVPFFLAVPGGLFLCIRSLQNSNKTMKALVITWWVLSGVFLMIVYGIMESSGYWRDSPLSNLVQFLSLVLSPVSTLFIGFERRSPFHEIGYLIRGGLGLTGIVFMIWILRRRRKLNENLLDSIV